MTIHYHGTPITPRAEMLRLAGRHFCVSFARTEDVEIAHTIGQSVLLDNGAFTLWTKGRTPDWKGYYAWCDRWLDYPTSWAVIPDVIDGGIEQNEALIFEWPFGERGAPVWHLHEPIDQLLFYADKFPRICFGSSGDFAAINSARWEQRVNSAFDALASCHQRLPWVHMLRGMSLAGKQYPFASLDSTDVARNHKRWQNSVVRLAERWDRLQCPARWETRPRQLDLVS